MNMIRTCLYFTFLLTVTLGCRSEQEKGGTLLLKNGKVWTGDENKEWAFWILIKDDRIISVGQNGDPIPKADRVIDLEGQLTVPGFNDSHVHFESAGSLLLGINLLDVNDRENLIIKMKETINRLPKGSWITRGDWGAYEAWGVGSEGSFGTKEIFVPHRNMIDDFTTDYPVLINRFDRTEGLANATALKWLGIDSESGLLTGEELLEAWRKIPEKSFERRLAETRRALEECRKWGVTTVQDMSRPDQLDVYRHLKEKGELTVRVNFSPSRLSEYKAMIEKGWIISENDEGQLQPAGDDWISFGTLKTHIDGIMGGRTALFYQPYSDNVLENRNWRGSWREFSENMPTFKQMILSADSANIQMRIHAIGDRANAIFFDIADTLIAINGLKDRRLRLVHAQVIAPEDFIRIEGLDLIAEVQPYHVTDDMRWMEERIGYERCQGAYAFKTLDELGAVLSFGSDWPGTNASYYPINPMTGLFAAVTRQTILGTPEEGWFPEQKITLEKALKAYTIGSAFGAFEEHKKGIIQPGMLADITVIDTDLFTTPPSDWLGSEISFTIVGGKVVYQK
ncbi:MAG TPA: amidohydrolase [Saprospiraceae bacterium]|nr:amidohydrolase [Saprospiraceae bacterium]